MVQHVVVVNPIPLSPLLEPKKAAGTKLGRDVWVNSIQLRLKLKLSWGAEKQKEGPIDDYIMHFSIPLQLPHLYNYVQTSQ